MTGNESTWSCVCIPHILSMDVGFVVSFTFEHYQPGSGSHESDHIELLDRQRRVWKVYANHVEIPGSDPVSVIFRVVPKD